MFLQKCDLRAPRERREPGSGNREPDGNCQNGRGGDAEGSGDGGTKGRRTKRDVGTKARRDGGHKVCNSQGPTAGAGVGDRDSEGRRRAAFSRPPRRTRVVGRGQRQQQRREPATRNGCGRGLSSRPVRGNCSVATGFNPWTAARAAFSFSLVQAPAGRLNAVQSPLKGAGG